MKLQIIMIIIITIIMITIITMIIIIIMMENIDHVVAGCKMLAQKEYKRRHDKVCLNLHWSLCRKFGYSVSDEW